MKSTNIIAVALYTCLISLTIVIAVTLWSQYRYFEQEAIELMQLKESYYQHIDMLKQSINASMNAKSEQEALGEELETVQKKKISDDETLDEYVITEQEFETLSFEEESRLERFKNKLYDLCKKNKKLISVPVKRKKSERCKVTIATQDVAFVWPVEMSKFWLSSLFGPRKQPNRAVKFHAGIDMAAIKGTPVKVAAQGRVIQAQYLPGYGNCILIVHDKMYKTRYAHLHTIQVSVGQQVEVGEIIGTVGDTGLVRKTGTDASHLHFEIHHQGKPVNPLQYLFT